MKVWHSTNDRAEIENKRDKIKANNECTFFLDKSIEVLKGVKTRITTNKFGVHILWIDKKI